MTVSIRVKISKASFEMTKGVEDQIEPIETRGRSKKASRLRDMLSTLKIEESIGDMRETRDEAEGCIDELDSMDKQLRDFVLESFNSIVDKLTTRDDATTTKKIKRKKRCKKGKEQYKKKKKKEEEGLYLRCLSLIGKLQVSVHRSKW